ncbi:MFS transporter [Nocardia sp. NBC_01730]|uniref:MFS transporter n=1 Tax=Nocardia sp. NBC_01730 TaxID=2975998 RepID=UPI002E160F8F|nr:MFS transporter [Nocardia sp. NBC_01730]
MSSIAPVLRGARIANSFAFGLQGFFFAVVLTELPQQKERFGLSDGLIVGSVVLVSLLAGGGSMAAERLALHRSSRDTLRIGLLLVALTGTMTAFAPNTAVLLIALGCYGIALGIVDASTNMQAVFIQHGYGTFILSSFYAAWSAGSITGALFVSGCEALDVTLRESLLMAAGIVLVAGLPLGPRLLAARDAETSPAETVTTGDRTVAVHAYLAFGIAMALVFAIDLAVGNWSALYLTDDLLADSATAALALAAYQGTSLIARLGGDPLVRRFGPRRVVRIAASVGVLGLAIVVAAPGPVVAIFGFLVAGIGMPVIAPLCFSAAGQLTSGSALDALIARLNLFNYAGTLVGGGVVGAVAAAFGHRAGFMVPLFFAAALIVLARMFLSHHEEGELPAPAEEHALLDE